MDKTHVVCTRYRGPNRVIRHAYGPYTLSEAHRVKNAMLLDDDETVQAHKAGKLEISVLKLLGEK